MRVLSVSSNRADFDILLPVWEKLARSSTELHILLVGNHADGRAVPENAVVHHSRADLGGGDSKTACFVIAEIIQATGSILQTVSPDVVLLVGDRMDMLPAAIATLPFNVPLAHIHGGEFTEGAIDDRIRHALTKLSHVHFVSTERARDRVLAMTEASDRIHITGAPGIDTLLKAPQLSREEFLSSVGLPTALSEFRLITVHPETNSASPSAPLNAVLEALRKRPAWCLITAPNNDPGAGLIRLAIDRFVNEAKCAHFVNTLGPRLYPNALRHASVMIGNSSSGIIEAGTFGLPVINVGDRQLGRECGKNVRHVANSAAAVVEAIDEVTQKNERFPPQFVYGDGKSSERIVSVLTNLPARQHLLRKSH